MPGRMLDPCLVLWPDQFHEPCRCATCDEHEERQVLARTWMIIYIRPSMRYFDHKFWRTEDSQLVLSSDLELLIYLLECCYHFCTSKSPNGLHAIPIQIVLITRVRLRVDRCSEASFLTFFMTWQRRQRRGNVALILECSWILWRCSLDRASFFRDSQLFTSVFGQCEFHAVSMCLSRALVVTGKQSLPMPCLAESGWLGCNRSDSGGGVISEWNAIGLPMHRFGSSGWACATSVPRIILHRILPSISGANSDDWRAHCVTPRLFRFHAVLCIGDDTSNLDPLRRRRPERELCWSFQGCFLSSWILRWIFVW